MNNCDDLIDRSVPITDIANGATTSLSSGLVGRLACIVSIP
jgi:hypothetical protein